MQTLTVADGTTPFELLPANGTVGFTVTPATGSGSVNVSSPQTLATADLTLLADQTLVSVGVINDTYVYRTIPPLTAPDGLNVVAPAAPPGSSLYRLFRRNTQAPFQAAWFVDPVAGDDRNAGTALAPLKSLNEWAIRFRDADVVTTNVTVTVLAGTVSEFAPLNIHIGTNRLVTIQGAVSSTAPRPISAVTATNPATNTRGSITDPGTAVPFFNFPPSRLRLTSGTQSGAITYCDYNRSTTTVAAVTGWTRTAASLAPPGNAGVAGVNPAINDNYVGDTLLTTLQNRIDVRVSGAGRLIFKDLILTIDTTQVQQFWRVSGDSQNSYSSVMFVGCQFSASGGVPVGFIGSNCRVIQSTADAIFAVDARSAVSVGGCTFASGVVVREGFLSLDSFNYIIGGIVQRTNGFIELIQGQIEAATAGGGTAWEVNPGCVASFRDANCRLWGPAAGYAIGVRTFTMAAFQYITLPTLTGSSTADAQIAGTNKTWATLPFPNPINLSVAATLP